MPFLVGSILQNRYRIDRLIEQGGFGAVYQAWDTVLDRPCALKENPDASPEAQRQFEREAKILAKLSHPNLPGVYDHFFVPGQAQYLVMELVEGRDLQAMLESRNGPLPEEQVKLWLGQVCDALDYLHAQSPPIIHRDIKPANIRVTPAGKAMLVDFGIAKVYDPGLKTTVGARAVTPGFSPQEQYGHGVTDIRSDVYALGATAYAVLTGKEPPESIQRNLGTALRPMRNYNPKLSPGVDRAVFKAMEMLPEQRFQSAGAFKAALSLGQPTSSKPAPLGFPRAARVEMWVVVLALFVLVAAISASVFYAGGLRGRAAVDTSTPAPALVMTSLPTQTEISELATPFFPSPTSTPATEPLPWVYEVAKGDTCSQIAENLRVSVQDIVELNYLDAACEPLFAGQKLLIPATALPDGAMPATSTPPVPAGTIRVSPADGMEMVHVPAGVFWMGSAEADLMANDDEKPRRAIYLDAFWIDRTEVTNGMYQRCALAGSCQAPANTSSATHLFYYGKAAFDDYPVIFVSWQNAQEYCSWARRRLPTEAEWEKAARGLDAREFPWGEQLPSNRLANYASQVGDTTPVGSYPMGASPYGTLDMSGNVAEWVADGYSERFYTIATVINPFSQELAELRVLRGGSWFSNQQYIRAAFRLGNYPEVLAQGNGFRCAISQ
ncbi:MAG: SUMF1/EgtB/PvdO family nonheme iron enzyme [Chloroflexota bacterium]